MIIFWVIAGFFVIAALLFILPPLLQRGRKNNLAREAVNVSIYQDQFAELEADLRNGTLSREQYQQALQELQKRLLQDIPATPQAMQQKSGGRMAAMIVGCAVPLFSVALYFHLGSPQALSPQRALPAGQGAEHADPQQFEAMVARLAARLEQTPDDPQGWVMLGRSYLVMGRYLDAAAAYSKASSLVPDDAQLWADYADALAAANGKVLQGRPVELINKALKADPNNHKALALAGSAAFETKNYPQAMAYWERLLRLLPEGSEAANSVSAGIAEARAMVPAGSAPRSESAAGDREPQTASAARKTVSGTVSLSAGLVGKASPSDALFVFARAPEGPKMPLAVLRLQAKDLPAQFSLDDSMGMSPAVKLSSYSEVVVGARISKSGTASPQSGDLQGTSAAVKVGSSGVKVVIDKVVP